MSQFMVSRRTLMKGGAALGAFGLASGVMMPVRRALAAPLTIGIASTQTNFAQSEGLGFLMAQAVFAGLPVFVVYLFFQRYIIQAVAGAAIR